MKSILLTMHILSVCFLFSCATVEKSENNSYQIDSTAFLDQTKTVPAQQEWNREIVSEKGGSMRFRIDSVGPVSILLMTEKAYNGFMKGDLSGVQRSDMILDMPSVPPGFEKTVEIPAGSAWFILQNLYKEKVEIRLRCYSE